MRRTTYISEALNKLNQLPDKKRLVEDLKGYFKNNYMKVFGDIPEGPAQAKKKAEQEAYEKALKVAKLDPTFKGIDIQNPEEALNKNPGSYFDWLMRQIKKGVVTYEDMMANDHEYTAQLTNFNDLKKRNRLPSDKKDIQQFKSLDALMTFLNEFSTTQIGDQEVESSDFKKDLEDVRKLLTDMQCPEIPESIKTWEDVLQYVGENDKWEIWVPKNKYGAYILDQWGRGAGWCVGGSGYRGRDATRMWNYFDHYNGGGAKYVCFQQKNKNAQRPTNKYLITLGPGGSLPQTSAGYQFNDSNNSTQTLGNRRGYGEEYQDAQMEAFLHFLETEGLTDIFKKSEFKNCECFLNLENLRRLENGEPYKYAGGKIKSLFKDAIKTIVFEGPDGKEYTVDAKEHPQFLNCESVEEMANMKNLIEGKPYEYDGEPIKDVFKNAIKQLTFNNEGKKYTYNVEEGQNDIIFKCKNAQEMYNVIQLKEGKPYEYDGEPIPDYLAGAIKEIVFADDYKFHVADEALWNRDVRNGVATGEEKALRTDAFRGCKNVEIIHLPADIVWFGLHAFNHVPDTAKVITPRFPNRHLHLQPRDKDKIQRIFRYEDESAAFQQEEEDKE